MSQKIIIFDTTLRDGEQALSSSLNVREKLQIALALEKLGVDVMEVGFPVSSPGDFESVQTIAKTIKNSRVCALARCVQKDIDASIEALKVADTFRLHMVLATSEIHVKNKLRCTFEDVLERATQSIKYARNYSDDIEFSCEDATRTNIDDLCRIVEAAIHAGATTVNIPDTVGYTVPAEYTRIIESLYQRVPNIDKAIISVHCHDDLGMSVANSISAIQAGARQVEGTINGLGERAGNCALEEVIMALKVRESLFNAQTSINHKELYKTSQLVSRICHTPIPANKAIVGSNAFSHSSGIHQDGILKDRNTYEILTPDSIGIHTNNLNLTSRSGRAAVKHHMSELGYCDTDYNLEKLYADFLKLADKKGQVFDYDLEALLFFNQQLENNDHYKLKTFFIQSGSDITPRASVCLSSGNETHSEEADGNGPVEAIYQAINRIIDNPITIAHYQISSKGEGKDALGQVNVIIRHDSRNFHGVGLATDVLEASALAYVNALNHVWRAQQIEIKKKQTA